MIFKVHQENIFGVKKLTEADLGQNVGHQTHIGLFEGILTYLSNEDEIQESYLIFHNNCERLDCYFDRIKNQDGSFRSPKIRMGNTDSIVRRIREYAAHANTDLYLLWFSLDNKELVFLLFEDGSNDFHYLQNMGMLDGKFSFTPDTLNYVFSRFDQTNENILVELELNVQGIKSRRSYRRIDIERANKIFQQTGKIGEELIYNYLDLLRYKSVITDFFWMNKSKESGLPYDFKIIQNDNKERFIDVKTTRFKFDSPIVFSSQETSFVAEEPILYSVFRTYDIENKTPKLRICDNSKAKLTIINDDYTRYSSICESHGYRSQSSFIVSPNDPLFTFSPDIIL